MTPPPMREGGANAGGEVDVTFFVPCLNEEARVVPTLESVRASMAGSAFSYEVIVVDDGSTDRTAAVVDEYRAGNPQLPVLLRRNPANFGLARSFVDAAFLGRGRHFRLICGDNIEPPESMAGVMAHLGQAELV